MRTSRASRTLLTLAFVQTLTTALTAPSGAGFSGQAALLSLEGYTWEDLSIEGGLAVKVSLGGGRRFGGAGETGGWMDEAT